ncbi:MAG: RsmB/NOP family class I SAM-dependent RNA methyltransferase [Alphaproteobacteria bacterium]|jgi:16S rRNA (cytosine967-C5)-methyltransferase
MSRTRTIAIDALSNILSEGRMAEDVLPTSAATLSEADARLADAMVKAALRHLGQLDLLIAERLKKPLGRKLLPVQSALRIGAAQLLLLRVPDHAAIGETVAAVKAGKFRPYAGLVNAVLRALAGAELPPASTNLPQWLRARWAPYYPVEEICSIAAELPPLDIVRRDGTTERFAHPYPPVDSLPGYAEGAFWVQDKAAQIPVTMLGDIRGKRVLEIGAAPGGKTAQLVAAGAHVTALDRSAARMAVLRANMARLKMQVEEVVADAREYVPAQTYDVVVLDAPCSATGTWRRHPELVHITTLADIAELAALQAQMLARAWGWVKPGGRLLYIVCSLEREEGEDQIARFLEVHKEAKITSPVPGEITKNLIHPYPPAGAEEGWGEGVLRTHPAIQAELGGMDGFFAAILSKKP